MLNLLLTLAIGALGGLLAKKGKVPGGLLIGAMLSVSIANVCFPFAEAIRWTKTATQILAGAFSGCVIKKEELKRIPDTIGPILLVIVTFLITDVLVSLFFSRVLSMSFITASFSLIPGSATNTPILAEEYGAKVSTVAVLQIVRLFAGVGLFPLIIQAVGKRAGDLDGGPVAAQGGAGIRRAEAVSCKSVDVLITLAAATALGLFGDFIGFPGGALVFSMVAVIGLQMIRGNACLPKWIKSAAQVMCGSYIGALITREDILNLMSLAIPALLMVLVYSADCFLLGWLLKRIHRYKMSEGMLMAIPAGASDILLIASDVGIEDADIVIVHIVRAIAAASLFPVVMGFLNNYLG